MSLPENVVGSMFIVFSFISISASVAPPNNEYNNHQTDSIGNTIKFCFGQSEITRCFKKQIIKGLDTAIKDNATWHLNDYLSVEKDSQWNKSTSLMKDNDLNIMLVTKVQDLAESRSLKFRVSPLEAIEGRKKKNKGGKGGFAMMGAMAMVGMMAQMIIGKLLLLAGGAFILAKIALLYSVISGLKKSGGSSSDHVIYAESGGSSGGHSNGWHRSIPRYANHDPYSSHYPEEEIHEST